MEIYSIKDKEFSCYGKELTGYDTKLFLDKLKNISDIPQNVEYVPSNIELEKTFLYEGLKYKAFGGMDIQIGWCNGHNTKLNCLEYHKNSEINIGTVDFILLLAKEEDIVDERLDSSVVKAFYVPAGKVVEIYATTLHYAPCSAHKDTGFQVAIVLPRGTNDAIVKNNKVKGANYEDRLLWQRNKWLIAHSEAQEAKDGAVVAIEGDNIDISSMI